MGNGSGHVSEERALAGIGRAAPLPTPTAWFRRRSWLAFQRALDPLGPPRPLPERQRRAA